jgi:hypothetical protein
VRQADSGALKYKEFILDWLAQFLAKVQRYHLAENFPATLAQASIQFEMDRQYRAFQPSREDIQLYDGLL